MEKAIQVKIVSPERTLFNGQAKSILVPGEKGSFEVLYNHAPIISSLSAGQVRCVAEETMVFDIAGGFYRSKREQSFRVCRNCITRSVALLGGTVRPVISTQETHIRPFILHR